MKRILPPLLVVVILLGIALAGVWSRQSTEATGVACADPLAGCTFSHAGTPVRVRFSMIPVPLEAFRLTVETRGARRAHAEFQMIGMDMGFNRYDLKPENGGFASPVTLPVCVSARHDWILYLELDGRRYALPFSSR